MGDANISDGSIFVSEENSSGVRDLDDGHRWDSDGQHEGFSKYVELDSEGYFKERGLSKSVMKVSPNGTDHHIAGAEYDQWPIPLSDETLRDIEIRPQLLSLSS